MGEMEIYGRDGDIWEIWRWRGEMDIEGRYGDREER